MAGMEKYQSPYGYPDEHMRLLGIVAAHWEGVELILERAVAKVMGHEPNRIALLTTNINFNTKLDILTAYVRDAFKIQSDNDALWREFTAIQAQLKDAQTARNTLVHSKWKPVGADGIFTRHKLRTLGGKVQITAETATIEDLVSAAQKIVEAGASLIDFLERNGVDLRQPNISG